MVRNLDKEKAMKQPMAVQLLDAPQAIEQVTRGEVEIQALLAMRNPRDPEQALQRTMAEATESVRVAEDCFYALPKGGKLIEGPSVRLCEIAARNWGNMRSGSRIVDVGDTMVTAQGYAWDLETNYVVYQERQRRITDKQGRRYSDDVIVSTANAAASIAFREAVIKTIGKTRIDPIWQQCRSVAVGDSRSLADRYNEALASFGKAGISEERILLALNRERRADVTPDDLGKLKGIATALREGEVSIDVAFPPPVPPESAVPKAGVSNFGHSRPGNASRETVPEEPADAPEQAEAGPRAEQAPPGAVAAPNGGQEPDLDRTEMGYPRRAVEAGQAAGGSQPLEDEEPPPTAADLEAAGQQRFGGGGRGAGF
jgi:hypothetical protein